MNFNVVYYILLIILIIVDIVLYLDEILNNPSSKIYQNKINKNTIVMNGYTYIKDDIAIAIDVPNDNKICISNIVLDKKIETINIKKQIICEEFIIGENVNTIVFLDLKCSKVISKSKNFSVNNGIIFDKFNNVICIFKEKSFDELKGIANNYSIRRDALRYFTNASYHQFVYFKGLFDIRYSKPYFNTNEHLFAIVPNRVNEKEIDSVTINFSYIDYIYLPSTVKRFVIEKKCEYDKFVIEKNNNYLTLYKNSLLYKKTQCFVSDGVNTLNKIGFSNQKDIKCNYKILSRNYSKINKLKDCIFVANDLQ